ncbi:MAG TPA: MobF family relaxase [Acidimicrobiales bacterium]|nr:MobF family relaxase [Acidimicrobiales bacterium]
MWEVDQAEVDRFAATRANSKARPGYDLVLRPPKSVSVLWALGDESLSGAIRDAHRQAVDAVLRFVEGQAVHARSRHSWIETHGVVAAAFDHRTSRAGDPLLHTHMVTANMTRTVEGKWRAIDGRGLFDHGRAGGYLYHAHLRHNLTDSLGLAWEPVVNGHSDVVGVPRSVIEGFSKRRDEITEVVAESGLTSARAHQAATLMTRRSKEHGVEPATLLTRWRVEATELGFGPEQVRACLDRASVSRPSPEQTERLFDRLAAPDGLTERAASFNRCDVVEALATCLGNAVDGDELGVLADRFLGSSRVIPLTGAKTGRAKTIIRDAEGTMVRAGGTARFTTPELLETERRVLRWAEDGFGLPVPTASSAAVETILASRPELSSEQEAMVRAVCGSQEALQPIVGRAGSGKTYALGACIDAYLASNVPVMGCAVSASAASRLEEATSLEQSTGRPADTIARLLLELDDPMTGGFAPGTVCFVDEASTVGTRDLARLAAHAQRAGGAIKLVGDPDQLNSVDVGGAFRVLAARRGEELVTLVQNKRQQDPTERLAVAEYREGKVGLALARYDREGKVIRSGSASESFDAMVADWYADRVAGINEPMIAGPNAIRRQLNARARAMLKTDGSLIGPALQVAGHEFCVGDEVVTRANNRQLHAEDRRRFVKNGSLGTVIEVDQAAGELVVDFTREGRIRLPSEYLQRGKVEHAYARTNFLAQGQDLQRTKYHPTDASRFEEGYVGLTRAVDETKIYVVDGHADDAEEDVSHTPSDRLVSDLDTVIAALEERGSQGMVHELDPAAASSEAVVSLAGTSLDELHRERERLDRILAKVPPPVDAAIATMTASRDALLARRQAWLALPPGSDLRSADQECSSPPRTRVVASLDRRLTDMGQRLARLVERQDERQAFLDDHQAAMARRDALGRAEVDRDLQLRFAALAVLPRALVETLGQVPSGQRERLHWSNAVQEAVIERDRERHRGGPQDGKALPDEGNANPADSKEPDAQIAQVIDRALCLLDDPAVSVSVAE